MNKKSSLYKIFFHLTLLLVAPIGIGLVTGREIIAFFGDSGKINIILFILLFSLTSITIYFFARFGSEKNLVVFMN